MGDLLLRVTDRQGASRDLSARSGETLMPVLRDVIDITIGTCGGVLSCGTCLVQLDGGWSGHAPDPGDEEREMLEALGAAPGARLACQLVLPDSADGLALTVAPEA